MFSGGVYIFKRYADMHTYMQSISCEMPGWKKHNLESRLLGEMLITSDMQVTPTLQQKTKN